MAVVSISLPDPLLARADKLIQQRGFAGRSELVRACVRDFIATNAAPGEATGHRHAAVTLVYPHGMERRFSDIRHTYSDVVRGMMHGHSGEACVELFVVEGAASRVCAFGDALRGTREALLVNFVYTDAWDGGTTPLAHTDDPRHGHETKTAPRGRPPTGARRKRG
ncbi:MAG: CopG family ribbon-helix-helix protein [Candidatus Thermoplasmatota archaeon]